MIELSNFMYPDENRVYVQINNLYDLKLTKTSNGLEVEIYPIGSTGEPIGAAWVQDWEAIEEPEEI